MSTDNRAKNRMLHHFDIHHLPPALQLVAGPFRELAHKLSRGPAGPEQTVALRKLLESMDAALRAARERESHQLTSPLADHPAARLADHSDVWRTE